MTHAEMRTAMRLWLKLEEARDIVADSRSSVFLRAAEVDPVTMRIVDLQLHVLHCIQTGQIPDLPKMGPL